MKTTKSDRGFLALRHPTYLEPHNETRVLTESSAIGDYDDAATKPGSSFLWIGMDHHLNREEVRQLVNALQHWLTFGRLLEMGGE
jgi:hypothetical protein